MDPKAMIGHVHLKVSDLERSIEFYRDVLGFDIVTRMVINRRSSPWAVITIISD